MLPEPVGAIPHSVRNQKRLRPAHCRSQQVPMADMSHPGHVQLLERWLKSYKPEPLWSWRQTCDDSR
jgi:phosphoketolase